MQDGNEGASPVMVENPQGETRWYWKFFLGNGKHPLTQHSSPYKACLKFPLILSQVATIAFRISEHQNLAGIDGHSKSPFFMSIMVEEEPEGSRLCRAILWTAQARNPPPPRLIYAVSGSSTSLYTHRESRIDVKVAHCQMHPPVISPFSDRT